MNYSSILNFDYVKWSVFITIIYYFVVFVFMFFLLRRIVPGLCLCWTEEYKEYGTYDIHWSTDEEHWPPLLETILKVERDVINRYNIIIDMIQIRDYILIFLRVLIMNGWIRRTNKVRCSSPPPTHIMMVIIDILILSYPLPKGNICYIGRILIKKLYIRKIHRLKDIMAQIT